MTELEKLWNKNSKIERARRRQRDTFRQTLNVLMKSLWAIYDLTGEPQVREAIHFCIVYGLGSFRGKVPTRLRAMELPLVREGRLVEVVEELLADQKARGKRSHLREAYATIAAQEGVSSPSFGSAIKRVERAYKARKKWTPPTDGHTGGRLLVGKIAGLDQLRALHKQITFGSPAGLLRAEQAEAVELPEEVTIRDVHWLRDDRQARRAIMAGEYVLLLRASAVFLPIRTKIAG